MGGEEGVRVDGLVPRVSDEVGIVDHAVQELREGGGGEEGVREVRMEECGWEERKACGENEGRVVGWGGGQKRKGGEGME